MVVIGSALFELAGPLAIARRTVIRLNQHRSQSFSSLGSAFYLGYAIAGDAPLLMLGQLMVKGNWVCVQHHG
jgi:hypothetical protein